MNTTAIYIKTDPEIKEKAQLVARNLGLSLSSILNAYLKQLIKTKTVIFTTNDEEPNDYTLAVMQQAEEDYIKGHTSPAFKSGEEAVAWLEKQGI